MQFPDTPAVQRAARLRLHWEQGQLKQLADMIAVMKEGEAKDTIIAMVLISHLDVPMLRNVIMTWDAQCKE